MRAVHQAAQTATLGSGAQAGNAGLFFERMGAGWRPDKNGHKPDKKTWIRSVCGLRGDQEQLASAAERLKRLVMSQGGISDAFKTTSRLLIGMGIANPIENALAWHRVLGTPYIPGSSVKGLVQAYAHEWAGAFGSPDDPADVRAEPEARARRIFGRLRTLDQSSTPDDDILLGSVVFLDAIPVDPVTLTGDVMTPHPIGERTPGGEPSRRSGPNPIEFLAVETGARFQFAVMPSLPFVGKVRANTDALEEAMSDCRMVMDWMTDALAIIGAGAKTKAGYGRFERI
ncbi:MULTISPECIES: type III-B CRISPR module RAMP protein Cmr6 [unclassified Bradyrhizobium]|uniref:type III-B CRISPR module RAMP protein Cmr6 n=1 Tax=unclassified Bradyrhizobium TaxID=2631580 RepID=UPI00291710EE|nr:MULTISPECIES: type III-B CRISPR module RAMP protein Cmr6 [unclassified Bradyrhizobium]